MSAPEAATFRADWKNWSACAAAANVLAVSPGETGKGAAAKYERLSGEALKTATDMAAASVRDAAAAEYAKQSAGLDMLDRMFLLADKPGAVTKQLELCVSAGIFAADAL